MSSYSEGGVGEGVDWSAPSLRSAEPQYALTLRSRKTDPKIKSKCKWYQVLLVNQ